MPGINEELYNEQTPEEIAVSVKESLEKNEKVKEFLEKNPGQTSFFSAMEKERMLAKEHVLINGNLDVMVELALHIESAPETIICTEYDAYHAEGALIYIIGEEDTDTLGTRVIRLRKNGVSEVTLKEGMSYETTKTQIDEAFKGVQETSSEFNLSQDHILQLCVAAIKAGEIYHKEQLEIQKNNSKENIEEQIAKQSSNIKETIAKLFEETN